MIPATHRRLALYQLREAMIGLSIGFVVVGVLGIVLLTKLNVVSEERREPTVALAGFGFLVGLVPSVIVVASGDGLTVLERIVFPLATGLGGVGSAMMALSIQLWLVDHTPIGRLNAFMVDGWGIPELSRIQRRKPLAWIWVMFVPRNAWTDEE